MHTFHRRSAPLLVAALLAAVVAMGPPAGSADAATTIYYNGAGSAPRISVLGDSTIAALRWTGQFEPLRQFNYTYDAESCRRVLFRSCRGREGYTPDTVVQAMNRLTGQLGSVVVIMGGYDDSSYGFDRAIDAVMAEAVQQGIPHVLFLSLRSTGVSYVGPGSISNSSTFRANNNTLYQKAIQYGPRLQIADWNGYSAGRSDWFYADGIHLRPAGANAAAAYIASQAARVIDGQIVTPPAGRATPSAPRSLTGAVGNGVGSGNVRLAWEAPTATGGVPISDYAIQRSWDNGQTWTTLSDGVNTNRTYVATGNKNGSPYRYRVAARNSVGLGPFSNVITTTSRIGVPAAPRSLAAAAWPAAGVGSGQVRLSWTAPATNGGAQITDYVIQRSWDGGQTWTSISDGVNTNLTFLASGHRNGAPYRFRVAARNVAGWGPASNVAVATAQAPTSVTAVAPPSTTVAPTTTAPTSTTSTTAPTSTTAVVPSTTAIPETATIGDFVWLDINGDGLQNDDEPGIADIVVVLRDASDAEVARDVTDQFGEYAFDVAPGSYFLEVELRQEFGMTLADVGPDDDLDSELTAVDDLEDTARTDVFAVPTERPDGFDLGLIGLPTPPVTEPPSTEAPTTAPTTVAPTTDVPTTVTPSTAPPTTVAPTTPPTEAPTTTVVSTNPPPPPTTAPGAPTTTTPGD